MGVFVFILCCMVVIGSLIVSTAFPSINCQACGAYGPSRTQLTRPSVGHSRSLLHTSQSRLHSTQVHSRKVTLSVAQEVLKGWMQTITTTSRKLAAQVFLSILVAVTGIQRSLAVPHTISTAGSSLQGSTHNAKAVANRIGSKASVELIVIDGGEVEDNEDSAFDTATVIVPSIASKAKTSIAAVPVRLIPTIAERLARIAKFPIFGKFGHIFRREARSSWRKLLKSLQGTKQDSLIMLIATSIVIPVFKRLNTSPIVGFMLTGTLLGPSGLNWVKDLHMVDKLGELGIVFFLFEMGLELSLERLKSMRKDVFGLGTSQFAVTAMLTALVCKVFGFSNAAAVTVGGSLALSSSAFVLQLLKDKGEMGTRHGRASFGILLLQDLAVVPLLIVVELLSKGGAGLGRALGMAALKGVITLSALSFLGRKLLNPIFSQVAKSHSQEAFLSVILATVLLMSFVTQGIGLSDTLGAFLAGLLLSETSYKYQVESDIAPFRGLLLGLFFVTVGFSIDMHLVLRKFPTVLALVSALVVGKALIITVLSRLFSIPLPSAMHTGLLTAQGGELAFVALAIAEKSKMISAEVSKLLLTTVALSMASTPLLAMAGEKLSRLVERQTGGEKDLLYAPVSHSTLAVNGTVASISTTLSPSGTSTSSASTGTADASLQDFVFICGYGRVGQLVCEMLDRKCIAYVVLENNPQRAREARSRGLPVYYGDMSRPEVLKGLHLEDARACVVTLTDMSATNKAVLQLRKLYPLVPIVARAKNREHQQRLENMFDEVHAMAPVIPEDSVLLTLPFAGAVLRNIGVSKPEIDAIMEEVRRLHIDEQTSAVELLAGGSLVPSSQTSAVSVPGVVNIAGSGGDITAWNSTLLSQGGGSESDAGVTVMEDVVRIRDAGLIAKAVQSVLSEKKPHNRQSKAAKSGADSRDGREHSSAGHDDGHDENHDVRDEVNEHNAEEATDRRPGSAGAHRVRGTATTEDGARDAKKSHAHSPAHARFKAMETVPHMPASHEPPAQEIIE